MQRTVTVTLSKDTEGKYSLSVFPLTITVAPEDEDRNPINVKWVLQEAEENPGQPNARQLTASFDEIPTPFTIVTQGTLPPTVENYSTPEGSAGAGAVSPQVRDTAVGNETGDEVKLYKYTIRVETNDGQKLTIDPHIKVRRQRLGRDYRDV